jgi:hypothetical protein
MLNHHQHTQGGQDNLQLSAETEGFKVTMYFPGMTCPWMDSKLDMVVAEAKAERARTAAAESLEKSMFG